MCLSALAFTSVYVQDVTDAQKAAEEAAAAAETEATEAPAEA